MYLAYDPGKTTGFTRFNNEGEPETYGQLSLEELMDHVDLMLHRHDSDPLKAVIYEQFAVYRHKAQKLTGSKMEVAQAIGIIKKLAKDTGATLVVQDASIKSVAEKWTQVSAKGLSHDKTHWIDAFNHGAYYLINQGIRKTQLEKSNEAKNTTTSD